ncbi:MAG: hypothetical protein ACRDRV_05780 [Pseudonocardiaceae bacterium]
MGIMAEVRRAGIETRGMSYVDGANRPLARVRGDLFAAGSRGGDVEIMRGDLTRILHTAAQADVEYLFSDSIKAMSERDEGIRVEFERAAPRTFHLVAGADGLHSTVRSLAFGAEPRFLRHLGCYISIFSAAKLSGSRSLDLALQCPRKLAAIHSARRNTEARAIFGFVSRPLRYDYRDSGQQKKLLLEAFRGEGREIPRLIDAMRHSSDFPTDPRAALPARPGPPDRAANAITLKDY